MSMLSERQRDELHKSILDYLHSQGLSKAYDALLSETGSDFAPDPRAKYSGLLEKKWTSVIRLQKKIMDLENRNAALQEELTTAPSRRSASQTDWVPRAPPRHTLTGHRMPVTRVAFHPLYSQLVSASEDATIKVWDWETGEFERTLKGHTKAVQDVEYDSKGIMLVSCSSDLTIKIWDTTNEHKNVKTLYGHDHSVSSSRFMPGDDFIISASRDKTIKVWEVASGYCVKTFQGHAEWVRCVLPSDDGKLLASCSNDHTARVWDSQSGETKMELRGHANVVEVAVFAPVAAYAAIRELAGLTNDRGKTIGSYVATGSRDKSIKLWDTSSGQCLKHFAGHDNWIRAIVFHPSGTHLLSASDDKTIRVWDLKTGRCTKTIEAHGHFVTCFTWGRATVAGTSGAANGADAAGKGKDGTETERKVNVCATGSVDQSVKVWTP